MRGQNGHLNLAATVGTSSELLPRVETLEGAFLRRLLGLFDIMIGSSDQQSLLHPLPDLANLAPRIVRLGFHLLRAAGPTPPLQSSIMIRLFWVSHHDLMPASAIFGTTRLARSANLKAIVIGSPRRPGTVIGDCGCSPSHRRLSV